MIKIRIPEELVNGFVYYKQVFPVLQGLYDSVVAISNGQKDGDYVTFSDGSRPWEGNGKIKDWMAAGTAVYLNSLVSGPIDFSIKVDNATIYLVLSKIIYDAEVIKVPTGISGAIGTTYDENGENPVNYDRSWKRWVEESSGNKSVSTSQDDLLVRINLSFNGKSLSSDELKLLHDAYSIFTFNVSNGVLLSTLSNNDFMMYSQREWNLLDKANWTEPVI